MKKIFIAIVFVASIVAGCQKTDIDYRPSTKIEFMGEIQKQTKASGIPSAENEGRNDNLYAQDFRVWAFKNWDDPLTQTNEINTTFDNIENTLISYKENNKKWDTGKDYYWPGVDKSLKFYAFSSSNWTKDPDGDDDVETVNVTHNGNTKALGEMNITGFKVTAAADNDLMVADACIQMQGGSTLDKAEAEGATVNNKITQTFRHALTKVRFNFISTHPSIPVFVQSIETTELYNEADITVKFGATTSFEWTRKGRAIFKDSYASNIDFAGKGVDKVWQVGDEEPTSVDQLTDKSGITLKNDDYTSIDTWLMIPQDLLKQTVTITYILKDRQFKRTFSLNAENKLSNWSDNQFVNYNITIAPNTINFDATVESWTERDVNYDA